MDYYRIDLWTEFEDSKEGRHINFSKEREESEEVWIIWFFAKKEQILLLKVLNNSFAY